MFQGVYSAEVANSGLRSTAEQATRTLNEFSDTIDSRVILAEWDVARSNSGDALRLRLKKESDEFTAIFQPSELVGEKGWRHMNHTYRKLLDVRIRRILTSWNRASAEASTPAEDD